MYALNRRAYLTAVAGVGVLAGCVEESNDASSDDTNSDETSDSSASEAGASNPDGNPPTVARELPLPASTDAIEDEMQPGAAKDAIPSIDDPSFMDVAAADDWLDAGHPVFGVVRDGEAKAYPQRILVWHEIVNDRIAGDRVAVTYCPLTGTVQGFERGGAEFGVSGQLVNSNLVMYDRPTESYWPQMLAVGVTGPHERGQLVEFNVTWTTWERWRAVHPETVVLTDDTGYGRDYGRDPYGSYNPPKGHYANENLMFPQFGSGSEHDFHPKRVVIGARTADGALAVVKDALAEAELVTVGVAGVQYVVAYDAELDTGWVYRNHDDRTVERTQTGVTVDGTEHAPSELPLASVVRYDAMWFAWEGYYPETEVVS
jgi:hypothetical protein